MSQPKRIFITGTDTDVGKTVVAGWLARTKSLRGERVGVYKPVASGCEVQNGALISTDATQLWNAAGKPLTLDDVCPQKFIAALSPPAAALAEGKRVCESMLVDGISPWINDKFDCVLIEGAGGLFSPISDRMLNIDLLKKLRPDEVILVAANRLGVIHQTIATCEAALHQGVQVTGIVLSQVTADADASARTNAHEVRRFSGVENVEEIAFRG